MSSLLIFQSTNVPAGLVERKGIHLLIAQPRIITPQTLQRNKNNDHTEKSIATLPYTEWQITKPYTGKRDTIVRDSKTWMWCDWCNLWSTTHCTLIHRSLNSSNSKSVTPKVPNNDKVCQGNLPYIVHYGSSLVDTNKLT